MILHNYVLVLLFGLHHSLIDSFHTSLNKPTKKIKINKTCNKCLCMFIVVLEYIFIFMLLYTSTVLDRRMKSGLFHYLYS